MVATRAAKKADVPIDETPAGHQIALFVCIAGVYTCYLWYGLVQEKITTTKYGGGEGEKFKFTLFLLFVQCCFSVLFATCALMFGKQPESGYMDWKSLFGGKPKTRVHAWRYMQIAACYVGAMLSSNSALYYINYPTQVIVKSCKMVPVMLVGVLWRGKRYNFDEYLRVIMVTLGIFFFSFYKEEAPGKNKAKADLEAATQIMGLGLAGFSLLLDGFTGPSQESVKESNNASSHQLMFYTNTWAALYCLAALFATGQGLEGAAFCLKHPEVLQDLVLFSILSATGQNFIFYLVRNFSSLTSVTVTTTRKFFTVLASIAFGAGGKGHTLTRVQWVACIVVFIGLGWEQVAKYMRSTQEKAKKTK